jgi:hypothetical protein
LVLVVGSVGAHDARVLVDRRFVGSDTQLVHIELRDMTNNVVVEQRQSVLLHDRPEVVIFKELQSHSNYIASFSIATDERLTTETVQFRTNAELVDVADEPLFVFLSCNR